MLPRCNFSRGPPGVQGSGHFSYDGTANNFLFFQKPENQVTQWVKKNQVTQWVKKNQVTQWVKHIEKIDKCDTLFSTMEKSPGNSVGAAEKVSGNNENELELPSWLSEPMPLVPKPSKSAKELLHLQYENMFESFIEQIYRGKSLKSLVEDDPRCISYEDFLRWIKRDPQRNERFKESQEMRTEFLASEILDIADGVEAIDPAASDTVNRDRLRIDTRKWLMSAHNKKRYGASTQIEMTGGLSVLGPLAAAKARAGLIDDVIDVEAK